VTNCDKPVLHGHLGKAAEPELHDCGYPDGSFACKIRHVQINTGAAKAAGYKSPPGERRTTEITPTGRIIR
jgi:hypothetical protein